ncbi:unnamed protein product [Adineta steineri]|uniref:Akirin n=1 Tax=Adineta steineri TaxID=433720 RepID=A0A814AUH0_9BILA|nr:unnamed protein product [Adineta steineri]
MASCMALKRSFEHDRDSSNNNPFESRTAASPSSSKRQRRCFPMTVVSSPTTMTNETTESTVFPDIQPILTTDVLLTRIKEEVRRLQRRHQMKIPTSSELSDDDNNTNLNECRSTTNSQHLLTLKQVNIICARLLKEREEKLREEYDRILSNKLSEQYEGFVRFTQDQLTRRFSELQFSYVS